MCRGCLKNTFFNRLEKHTYMNTTFVLATGCANGFTMLALGRQCCCGTDCSGDALWYAAQMQRGCSEVPAQMHGFCTGCCGVRTLLQQVGCRCGSIVLRNDDAVVVHSVSNSASTAFCDCKATVVASVHHCACRLRCRVFAPRVAMLFYSAASAKQYGRGSFALLILHDDDVRDTDVSRKQRIAGRCVSHDALIAVGGKIPKRARTCFSEYLQCADATASGDISSSVGIAHTPGGKCADVLFFPNFKAITSRRLKPHAEYAEWILNTNHANFTKGNVGSRLGSTEWTGSLARFFRASCEDAKSAKRDSPSAPHICPISASSTAERIMPRITNQPSENARK